MRLKSARAKYVLGLLLLLSPFGLSSSAVADPTPSPSPSPSAVTPRTPLEQYKVDREIYLLEVKARDIAIRTINQNFKNAIDKSTVDYRMAMQLAKSPDQKFQANSARKNAIALAISARDDAIASLGAEPTPPAEPMKMAKPKITKSKKR